MLLEVVDTVEKIREFLSKESLLLKKAFVTEETVTVHYYGAGSGDTSNISSPGETHDEVDPRGKKRNIEGNVRLLRIFIGESDHRHMQPLYFSILAAARRMGLAGCTVFRGLAGFGASSVVHRNKLFRFSQDLPILVEIVDSEIHIATFLEHIRPMLQGALVTEEDIFVHHYQSEHSPEGTKST